jgi:short-subunit dehydrogenase
MAKGFAANDAIVYILGRRQAKLDEAKAILDELKGEEAEIHA